MPVVKIMGSENKHVRYLFNRIMPVAREYGAGGRYELPSGNVTVKVCSAKALERVKELFNELKIKFTVGDE